MIYPLYRTTQSERKIEKELAQFKALADNCKIKVPTTMKSGAEDAAAADYTLMPLFELFEDMQQYNLDIYTNGQEGLKDPFSYQQASFDLTQYGLPNNIIGYITIPKIDVELPIYLGATNENMKYGAAHLSQTSLPIGGINTNCVLAGHRGTVNRGPMFKNIDLLEIGDEVTVTNLWETLRYEVSEIEVIAPNDVDEVKIREGEELLTLLSCHPYPQNTQRILIICKRAELRD